MIGQKKLSTIREDLKRAFATVSDDPIDWLEQRMAAGNRATLVSPGESEVLLSLRRLLELPPKPKARTRALRTKK